jgi:CDGSH iron-sulfur domain-containing protein 3
MTMAEQAKIAALDGPYLVKDPVVVDAEGDEFRSEHETIALCRCGRATTKPFCDGTHSNIGFQVAERAVRKEEEQQEKTPAKARISLARSAGLEPAAF